MTPREKLENDILTALKCACEQNRLDVADLMLAALEELDRDRQEPQENDRPLIEAYREVAKRT
jgi:uncharacterized protein YqeY